MGDIIIDICFCIIFLSVPLVALRLLPFAGVSIYKFSIPSLFIIFYLVFAYIGILPLYFGWAANPVQLGVVNKGIILRLFMYSSSSLIMIILGFISARHLIGLRPGLIKERVLVAANRAQRTLILCLFLLCILVLLTYVRQLGDIAIIKALEGDFLGAAVARSNMGNAFSGTYWHYQIFFRLLLDYCVIFFFADYLVMRRRMSAILFIASFAVASFSATMAIEKGPLVNLTIMLYLTYVLYKGGNYWQPVGKYFLLILGAVMCLLYYYFMGGILGERSFVSEMLNIPIRIFAGQITPAYFYLDLFPGRLDYLMGSSLPNPGGVLPFKQFPLTMEVSNFMYPSDFSAGVVGSAPTVFWGEMYVNFGPIAIIVFSFLVGVGLFAVSHVLSKQPLSPPVIAATILLAMHYKTLSATSLSNYFIDTALVAIFIVTYLSLKFKGRGSGSTGALSLQYPVG